MGSTWINCVIRLFCRYISVRHQLQSHHHIFKKSDYVYAALTAYLHVVCCLRGGDLGILQVVTLVLKAVLLEVVLQSIRHGRGCFGRVADA